LRAAGGRLHVLPAGRKSVESPSIADVQPSDDARLGTATYVLARVKAPGRIDAIVSLLAADGHEVSSVRTPIEREQMIALPMRPQQRGPHRMRVLVAPADHSDFPAASADVRFTVSGPPTVLICDADPFDVQPLKRVIEQLHFACQVLPPSSFAEHDDSLSPYD